MQPQSFSHLRLHQRIDNQRSKVYLGFDALLVLPFIHYSSSQRQRSAAREAGARQERESCEEPLTLRRRGQGVPRALEDSRQHRLWVGAEGGGANTLLPQRV